MDIRDIAEHFKNGDQRLVERAFVFAAHAHEGQTRAEGSPYIVNPIAVARELADLGFDAPSIAAAFLHDVVEDCGVTRVQIAEEFGDEVAALVDGVTKLKTIRLSGMPKDKKQTDLQTESLKKIYLFYSFKNAGKGKAVNVPVEAVVGGSVTVPLGTPQTASLANAYCPKESCKFPGKVTVNPGASLPAVMAASFTILSPSDVLSRPLFQYTSYAYVVLHAQGRLPADNKPCTPAENFTVHYKK